MDRRSASVIVCDDIRAEISGKLILIGVYTNDIAIPSDEFTTTQIQFLFMAECARVDPFKSLKFEVTLPGNEPVGIDLGNLPSAAEITVMPERKTLFVRQVVAISGAKLRPGKISAKVVHERGEIEVPAGWIVKVNPPPSLPAAKQ